MIIKDVQEALSYVQAQFDIAVKKAETEFPIIQKLEEIKNAPIANISASNAFNYKDGWGNSKSASTLAQLESKLKEYEKMLESNIEAINQAHLINIPRMENNKAVFEKVTLLMNHVGIPRQYYHSYFKSNRSSKKTTDTLAAGYIGDLSRNCPTTDGFEYKISSAKAAFENIKAQYSREVARIRKEAEVKEKAEKASKGVMVLERLQVKYGLDEYCSWNDVLDVLEEKDKYFMLALAMEDTRGDWSEGFYRVESALDHFKVETEEDKKIYDNVSSFLEGDHEDGRVFRDCEYNYSYLYTKANPDILKDYETLSEYYSRNY